jgi:7-keto-8-aminopelargonate synthetase-like enzyme
MVNERLRQIRPEMDCDAAVAEFIRTRGVTRCPTACVLPTQGAVAAADRDALEEYAARRDQVRRVRLAARMQQFWTVEAVGPAEK